MLKFPEFLTELTVSELMGLYRDLKQYPEDKDYVALVMHEIARRAKETKCAT